MANVILFWDSFLRSEMGEFTQSAMCEREASTGVREANLIELVDQRIGYLYWHGFTVQDPFGLVHPTNSFGQSSLIRDDQNFARRFLQYTDKFEVWNELGSPYYVSQSVFVQSVYGAGTRTDTVAGDPDGGDPMGEVLNVESGYDFLEDGAKIVLWRVTTSEFGGQRESRTWESPYGIGDLWANVGACYALTDWDTGGSTGPNVMTRDTNGAPLEQAFPGDNPNPYVHAGPWLTNDDAMPWDVWMLCYGSRLRILADSWHEIIYEPLDSGLPAIGYRELGPIIGYLEHGESVDPATMHEVLPEGWLQKQAALGPAPS